MKLRKSSRFGLLAVLELARAPGRHRSAGEIAEKHGISLNHLAKVLRTLVQAGLVESTRGAGGGYRFCGNARRVTLLDVILLFESIGKARQRRRGRGGHRDGSDIGRGLNVVLAEIDDIAHATLRSVTLSTLLDIAARRAPEASPARDPPYDVFTEF